MKKFINEKADINNPKWNNLIHREKKSIRERMI